MTRPEVKTEAGVVAGVGEDESFVFRGIPYAAPPIGALRFAPPAPRESWDGVRDASQSGPGAPQPPMDDELETLFFNPPAYGEDCLTLDVWTPDPTGGGLPVMVWIHGGAFIFGAGSAPAYSGRAFARDGVVHVAINYRLGVEGFIHLGEGTDNLGLRDQVAALEWVQRNIASFGGDPSRVTVFGESAGALSVNSLLSMPSAEGLFSRAISQSGSSMASVPVEDADKVTRRLARRLGIPPTVEGFRSVPVARTVDETLPFGMDFANPLRHGSPALLLSPFRAVHGTPSMPEPPLSSTHLHPGVPLLTGTTRNETIGFLKLLGRLDGINPLIGRYLLHLLSANRSVRRAYRQGPRKIENPLALVEAAWTDWAFRIPTIRFAERRGADSFLYEFRWENPAYPAGLGAAHTLDVPFVVDNLDTLVALGGPGEGMVGTQPPQALATEMHATWIRFATTGDPGWPTYDTATRSTMVFGATSEVVSDPAGVERAAWAGRL